MTVYYRTLLFAIPEPKVQREVIEAFRKIVPTLCKDGKPYIKLIQASRVVGVGLLAKGSKEIPDDQPADGYTVIITMALKSYDDVLYYENEDPEHFELKERVAHIGLTQRPLLLTSAGVEITDR